MLRVFGWSSKRLFSLEIRWQAIHKYMRYATDQALIEKVLVWQKKISSFLKKQFFTAGAKKVTLQSSVKKYLQSGNGQAYSRGAQVAEA